MRVQVLGCGDAFGSGGRFNTCFHVSVPEATFLVDCGASALIAMRRFGKRFCIASKPAVRATWK